MPAHIRSASPGDAQALVSVTRAAVRDLPGDYYSRQERNAWIEGISEEGMRQGVRDADTHTFIAESDAQAVGFSTLQGHQVRAVYVRPNAQGQGVGSDLLGAVEKLARAEGVRVLNVAASLNSVGFYQSHGYEKVGQSDVQLDEGLEIPCIDMRKAIS